MSNLVVMTDSEHARHHMKKYYDTIAICGWCGKEFVWAGLQQQRYYSERRTGRHHSTSPFCSRECSGHYGKHIQEHLPQRADRGVMRKLSEEQVRYIREHYIPHDRRFGSRALARQFDVDRTVIDYIIKGRTYKDVL